MEPPEAELQPTLESAGTRVPPDEDEKSVSQDNSIPSLKPLLKVENEPRGSIVSVNRLRPYKIVTVGDTGVGKTSLLIAYSQKKFPSDHSIILFDIYSTKLTVENTEYNISLWDDAGLEEYQRLKPLPYPNTDCFLLCFSVVDKISYKNLCDKWIVELRHHCPTAPVILVGTKTDLREDKNKNHITLCQGLKMRRKLKVAKYIECSSKNLSNVDQVILSAVEVLHRQCLTSSSVQCCVIS